jgi:integrase
MPAEPARYSTVTPARRAPSSCSAFVYQPKLKSGGRSSRWWIKYYDNGRVVREGARTEDKDAAKRLLKQREGAAASGQAVMPRLQRIKYDELAKDLTQHYRTTGRRRLEEVEDRLAHLERFFAGRRVTAITPDVVTEYVAKRQAEKTRLGGLTSNRTINIELALLRRMLRLGYEQGKVFRVPPVRLLKERAPRAGFFERASYEAVRRRLRPDLQVAVSIAHTFGWRIRSEVLTLERRHLDLEVGTLRLDPGMTKNGEGREVYLTPELRRLLAEQLARVEQLGRKTGQIIPWLFPRLRGRRAGQRRRSFRKAWATACDKAGVPGMLLHDFRRTAVRNMVNAGVPERVAMKVTGHRTRAVFDRYHIVSPGDLQDVARKLSVTGTFPGTSAPAVIDGRSVSP